MIEVLVIEDDFRVADLHCEFVERCEGFHVVGVALSAEQAIELNRDLQPDLLLLDLYLPDAHGLDIAQRLREESGADIIVVTAARDVASIKAAMQQGALHYLVKPFQFEAFRERFAAYRSYRDSLGDTGALSQRQIDEAVGALRTTQSTLLPKGLSRSTLHAVEQALAEADRELTSEEIAHLSGVSRVTARRYLAYLVEVGKATVESEYGTPGRPKHLYQSAG